MVAIEATREGFGDPTDTKPVIRILWYEWESNPRQPDLQSGTLPTELSHQYFGHIINF